MCSTVYWKKQTIRVAKIRYYDKLFTQYKGDIKKTWQTMSDIICKSNTKRKALDKIIVTSKVIIDKEDKKKYATNSMGSSLI